jgi:hypothetical protein
VLALVGVAQLMVTLDVTTVQIALPSAPRALRFSTVQALERPRATDQRAD